MTPHGIRAEILRGSSGPEDRWAVLSRRSEVVVGLPGGGPFRPSVEWPGVILRPGGLRHTVVAVPTFPGTAQVLEVAGAIGPMFGGSYIATNDGRFRALAEKITGAPFYGAIALHDRYEPEVWARDLAAEFDLRLREGGS